MTVARGWTESGFSPNVQVSLCPGFKISDRALLLDGFPGFVADRVRAMEQRWNETDMGEQNYWEKTLSQCHFVYHISHMD
jgi:hypothetical protein